MANSVDPDPFRLYKTTPVLTEIYEQGACNKCLKHISHQTRLFGHIISQACCSQIADKFAIYLFRPTQVIDACMMLVWLSHRSHHVRSLEIGKERHTFAWMPQDGQAAAMQICMTAARLSYN